MNTAERIYSASTSEDAANARLADRLARLMEDDIASRKAKAGSALGSLGELCARYNAGRASVRESIGLLERRGLGRLRPGPCGGFILEQPDTADISAQLADYFRIINITSRQLMDAREAIDLMSAGMAASAGQPPAQLHPLTAANALDLHLDTRSALARLSGDTVVPLLVSCLNLLTLEFLANTEAADHCEDTVRSSTARIAELSKALHDGNAALAMEIAAALHLQLEALRLKGHDRLPLPTIDTARLEHDRTLSSVVARRIAAEILAAPAQGYKLGSEWELCDRFSVSRTTLRQSIRQLQDMGLVECRRGRGNGLVARDLRVTGGIRLVLAFLISHQSDPRATGAMLFQLNRFVPALAVFRATPDQRAALQDQLNRVQHSDHLDRFELLRLVQLVSRLADSPIIDFFSRSLAAYEARFHPSLATHFRSSLQGEYFELLQTLLDTIKTRDAETLQWAKEKSSKVMMAMSCSRPI